MFHFDAGNEFQLEPEIKLIEIFCEVGDELDSDFSHLESSIECETERPSCSYAPSCSFVNVEVLCHDDSPQRKEIGPTSNETSSQLVSNPTSVTREFQIIWNAI